MPHSVDAQIQIMQPQLKLQPFTKTPAEYGRVAVLLGGNSAEREVSLNSGQQVLQGLLRSQINAFPVDLRGDILEQIANLECDRAVIMLHGGEGENGDVQALLHARDIPYASSSPKACAITLNKVLTKQIFLKHSLATAEYVTLSRSNFRSEAETLGLPFVVKPVSQGSTIGTSRVMQWDALADAVKLAYQYDDLVFAERFIDGDEFTVGILCNQGLPSIRIETKQKWYDYNAKYQAGGHVFHCPGTISANKEQEIQNLALTAFEVTGCQGWGRVDLMQDKEGKFWLLEVNTIPGMTEQSLVPHAAQIAGISFDQLVRYILETSFFNN